MAQKIDQKAYLKKYLSGDKTKKKKKKVKKHTATVKIIDDDLTDTTDKPTIDEELLLTGDDAPQIVGEYVDLLGNGQQVKKWRSIAVKDEPEDDSYANIKQEDEADLWGKKAGPLKDPVKIKKEPRGSSAENSDQSPPRRRGSDQSPPRRNRNSPARGIKTEVSDQSPPRRERKDSDQSPPRRRERRDSDQSPPRRRERKDSDQSPPRRRVRKDSDQSPPRRRERRDSDQSPPRRRVRKDSDQSPPRRRERRDSDQSPPRRRVRKDSDQSPPRRRERRDLDQSPPRRRERRDSDQSPPRRRERRDLDQSPPRRRERKDSDQSPPRRRERRDSDQSPPRRTKPNTSPPRRHRRNDDQSPPRRNGKRSPSLDRKMKIKKERDSPQPRKSRWEPSGNDSPPPSHKPKVTKTLDGKTAGLQDAKALKTETEERRRREDHMYTEMSTELSGRDAEVQVRNTRRMGRRAREAADEDPEVRRRREERELQKQQLYDRWGKGLKQIADHEARRAEQDYESSKPLARMKDDEDLERHLREQERLEDPMLEYMRQKKKKQREEKGLPAMPEYKGSFPENRFGIRPGYRWDGVDRSNGFEKKWFDMQNAKRALQDEAYKYSVEDM